MGISQYFEWNQNLLNFCYFIDFEFQMGNIMVREYSEATSPLSLSLSLSLSLFTNLRVLNYFIRFKVILVII